MNIETDIQALETDLAVDAPETSFTRHDLSALDPLAVRQHAFSKILDDLIKVGDRATIERTRKLQARLGEFEPAITMIGQVKAGKTSLVNAMIGMPALLPADVNPWTSVVTSLHLDPKMSAAQNSARFEFLDRMDWDRLVKGGGRIGELARRAGAESELQRVTDQVAALREKSRKRLGSKFEMLLGQEHDYGFFDNELIERYVCLGVDFEDDTETSKDRGRFADITKAAHIHMAHKAAPIKICVRDTPGVNDTFLVREQITMKAIRGSQLCVVVLAAHQALSSVDMALVRLISNLKSRDVIIFVNRIDELADPKTQVPEIRASLTETLKAHHGPEDAEIIFGSAAWATHLLNDTLTELDAESADALLNYTRAQLEALPHGLSDQEIIWHLSGLSGLQRAVANRIASGAAETALQGIERHVRNLLNGIKISDAQSGAARQDSAPKEIDAQSAQADFAELEKEISGSFETGMSKLHTTFADRIARVHESYLDRATAALVQHLETAQDGTVWSYDPTGLRMLLRSSYQTYAKRSKDLISQVFTVGAEDLCGFFERVAGVPPESFEISPPQAAPAPEPVVLGKTIALDLQSSWWATWLQSKTSARLQSDKFRKLIEAETAPIMTALLDDYAASIRDDAQTQLNELLDEQRQVLTRMTQGDEAHFALTSKREARIEMVNSGLVTLDTVFKGEAD
ncbi:MAG: dynamin family protein [Pseudomonadota bacterium]